MSILANRTPADIDTELAGYDEEAWCVRTKNEAASAELSRFEKYDAQGGHYKDAITRIQRRIEGHLTRLEQLRLLSAPLEEEYHRRPWTRAFLVVGTGNGHVHKSMSCATCFATTQSQWLPQYSGLNENQVVEDAGARACTTCWPTAPNDVLGRPTRIFSRDEEAAAVRRVERTQAAEKKAAAKALKTVIHPDGKMMTGPYGSSGADNVNQVTSGAVRLAVNIIREENSRTEGHYPYDGPEGERADKRRAECNEYPDLLHTNLEGLAAFHGTNIEIQADLIREKALASYTKDTGAYDRRWAEQDAELKKLRKKNRDRKNGKN